MRIAQICILYMYYRFMTSCTSVTYTELEQVQSQCTRGSYQVLRREDPSLVSPFQQHCELAMMHTLQDLATFVDYNDNNTYTQIILSFIY